MNARHLCGLFVIAALVAGPAHAQREPVPIVNHPDIAVATGSGKPVQAAQVKGAIEAAAKTKGWTLAYEPGGAIVATLVVRGKHTVVVGIPYTAEKYSLLYRDSINMKYVASGERRSQYDSASAMRGYRQPPAGALIHPFYNDWVRELKDAIRIELLKV